MSYTSFEANNKKYDFSGVVILAAWFVLSAFCLFYATLAFQYFFSFGTGQLGFWEQILSFLVSSEFATGAGSVHQDQATPYSNGYYFLLPHTMFGAVALAIGPFQFMSFFRKRYMKLHRSMGKIYLLSMMISMFFGIAYLITTPMGDVFSGKPFSVGLIGLDLLVLFTGYLAYVEIKSKHVVQHQAWMAFNFSLIFATPMLRILWVVLAWVAPQYNQAELNVGIMTFLLPFCLLVGMLWYSYQNTRVDVFKKGGAAQ